MASKEEWSAEQTEKLCALWESGESASSVARQLNVTRNAVIGKVHRLRNAGHEFKRKKMDKAATVAASHAARAVARIRAPKKSREGSPNLAHRLVKLVEPKVKTFTPPAPVVIDASCAKPWTERAFGECAYPIGGEGADTVSCCAITKAGSSYCAGHHRLMFHPPKQVGAKYEKRISKLAA